MIQKPKIIYTSRATTFMKDSRSDKIVKLLRDLTNLRDHIKKEGVK